MPKRLFGMGCVVSGVVHHLYVHVPFCRSRCPYCDYTVTLEEPNGLVWIDAIRRELDARGGSASLAPSLRTILLGGGTPSWLGVGFVRRLGELLGEERVGGAAEWTAEANPEDITEELLRDWISGGVTRVSLGVQSMAPEGLEWLDRRHDPGLAEAALRRLASSDLASWSVDLLYGLPTEVESDPTVSLDAVLTHDPPHIALQELTPEPGTRLGDRVERGAVELAGEERRAEQYLSLVERLSAEGYTGYEAKSFARPGHESAHHRAVHQGEDQLGLGPGAHSRLGGRRHWNLRDWGVYLTTVRKGELPEAGNEVPEPEQLLLERLWSLLSLAEGIPSDTLQPRSRELVARWIRAGWAVADPARARLTFEGWLRLDGLVIELAQVERGEGGQEGDWREQWSIGS